MILDKNVEKWGHFETPDWEQWFDRSQVEKILRRYCSTASSRPIAYWEDVQPDGLFLVWLAVK
jgi:malonyl-CoA O-methyltransferase